MSKCLVLFVEGDTEVEFYKQVVANARKLHPAGRFDTNIEYRNVRGVGGFKSIALRKFTKEIKPKYGDDCEFTIVLCSDTDVFDFAPKPPIKWDEVKKDLAEIIKYAEQYKTNRSYHIAYKKSKNPDAYFRRYESQLILYGGARRVLEQTGINLKGLNVDKLKAEYQELMKQKSELTSTYKDCEKEVRKLKRKQENLNQYLGRTQPNPAQEQPKKNKNQSL